MAKFKTWNGTKIASATEAQAQKNVVTAALYLVGAIKKVITRKRIVDTGRLRSSINYITNFGSVPFGRDTVKASPKEGNKAIAHVGTNVFYAPYHEFGTSRGIQPRPYMRPAFKESITKIRKLLNKGFGK